MKNDPIRLLFVSDIHFGIRSVSQEEMTKAFCDTVFPLLPEIDIFFINGDFFDTLVIFDNHGFDPIYDTILNLFRICEEYKVTLRVLQGTWGHDRNQCRRFLPFYRNGGFTFNFKYFGTIDLEEITIRDRSLKISYIPDSLPFKKSDDIVEVLTDKMKDCGWDYLDYVCAHGFFDFTFPKNVSQNNVIVYTESQFPFVRKAIDVGHVHDYRISGKVISNGSFDRLVAGDEDPKGCIKILDYPDHYTAHFIENKDAAIIDTIIFTKDDTTETIIEKVRNHIASLSTKRKISLRFIVDVAEHRDAIKSWMQEVYPDVRCSIKRMEDIKEKSSVKPTSVLITTIEKKIAPTPATIAPFIRSHMPEDYILSIDEIEKYIESLDS